jgi:hypothetical protein
LFGDGEAAEAAAAHLRERYGGAFLAQLGGAIG